MPLTLLYEFFLRYHSNIFFFIVAIITLVYENLTPYTK